MKSKDTMYITVERAMEIILKAIDHLPSEIIPAQEAHGRVLAGDIIAECNIPPCDNSAMDGFALRCKDTSKAAEASPVILSIKDERRAGDGPLEDAPGPNETVRIMTGAPVPVQADGVIPVEDITETDGCITLKREIKKHENIRFAGEDISIGQIVLQKGKRLKSADIGLLASLNYKNVEVTKRPEVAIISTGDEVVEVGEELPPCMIRNSNAWTLNSEIEKYNAIPHYLGIAGDSIDVLKKTIKTGLQYDIVITTGGVSMGDYDFVSDVINELGLETLFTKVKMKPGKPFIFATKGSTLFFGLPGNPVSTMISFMEFVRPAILSLMGASRIDKPIINAVLKNDIKKKPERKHFIRGFFSILDGTLHVSTTGSQGSGILRSMSIANCLIILDRGISKVSEGDIVPIQLIEHEEI